MIHNCARTSFGIDCADSVLVIKKHYYRNDDDGCNKDKPEKETCFLFFSGLFFYNNFKTFHKYVLKQKLFYVYEIKKPPLEHFTIRRVTSGVDNSKQRIS